MKKILITGFERFGPYAENTSGSLAGRFPRLPSLDFHYLVIPPRIFSAGAEEFGEQLVAKALAIKADAIISLGMSSSVDGLRIESRAVNWSESKYCLPTEQKRKVDPFLPAEHRLAVDLERWDLEEAFFALGRYEQPFENKVSTDAGTFCCNALMFRTLFALENRHCNIPYLFINVPCTKKATQDIPDFDHRKELTTASRVIAALLVISVFARTKSLRMQL